MRIGSRSFAVLMMAALVLPLTVAYAVADRAHTRASIDQSLTGKVNVEVAALSDYFERARAITLLSAHNPAFRDFYEGRGSGRDKARSGGLRDINRALGYLETLYPSSIGEACLIDFSGAEEARVVRGYVAPARDLSPDESGNPFFTPTFALEPHDVYQAQPYISPDTGEWVISNSAVIPTRDDRKHAFVHFEVTVESFRLAAAQISGNSEIEVVDSQSGKVILSTDVPQRRHAPLGEPADHHHHFVTLARSSGSSQGSVQWDGERSAYALVPTEEGNANHLIVFASRHIDTGLLGEFSLLSILLCIFALGLFITALISFRTSHHGLEEAVRTDALTGLGSRRKLLADIGTSLEKEGESTLLVLCDLDGFKSYNDTYGHPAGDLLLASLGSKLRLALDGIGLPYRMGGDEFCALIPLDNQDATAIMDLVGGALSEAGDGFHIRCSRGSVVIPAETSSSSEALRIADRRMYQHKNNGRASAGNQSAGVLLQALRETDALLGDHVSGVAKRAELLGQKLGLTENALREVSQAAQLHDIGKIAIPEAILNKPGRLDDLEWAFMKTHTLVGERIISAAPALAEVGKLVRSSHERYDGGGYPDQLTGAAIPMGSRIIFICDAFDAITSDRSYQSAKSLPDALAEMRRCSGSQFDPEILLAFCEVMEAAESSALSVT